MTAAKRRTPVGHGTGGGILRASGHVQEPVRNGRNISCTLAFGGAAEKYAVAVHEHLSEHSPLSWIISEVFGDGVNLASRILTEAEPGEIVVSDAVFNNVRNKADITARDLGERRLKNVSDPVRLFVVAV